MQTTAHPLAPPLLRRSRLRSGSRDILAARTLLSLWCDRRSYAILRTEQPLVEKRVQVFGSGLTSAACSRPGHRQNPTGTIRGMSQRSPEPCRHGGTAPYPRGTDPGARRQTLRDTDRNGADDRLQTTQLLAFARGARVTFHVAHGCRERIFDDRIWASRFACLRRTLRSAWLKRSTTDFFGRRCRHRSSLLKASAAAPAASSRATARYGISVHRASLRVTALQTQCP
jgi:hypothetical protein